MSQTMRLTILRRFLNLRPHGKNNRGARMRNMNARDPPDLNLNRMALEYFVDNMEGMAGAASKCSVTSEQIQTI
jgi:hypothetical protein